MRDLAARIRETRERKGLRLVDVDTAANLHAGHCRLIEERLRKLPSIETVRKIAIVLGVTIDWLATGEHPSTPALEADKLSNTG